MALYKFTIDNILITTIRSRFKDTDHLAFGVQVRTEPAIVMDVDFGRVGTGVISVGKSIGPVFVSNSSSPIVFGYVDYNGDADGGQDSNLQQTLKDAVANLNVSVAGGIANNTIKTL